MTYSEYHLLTAGELEDMITCGSIASGTMAETVKFAGIPDLK